MLLPPRLEHALSKLYAAYHSEQLNPEDCLQCAVGNICDNQDFWKNFTKLHGSTHLNYVGLVNEKFGRRFYGYSPLELLQIEAIFLKGCGYTFTPTNRLKKPAAKITSDMMFDGLCDAVDFLCALDRIENVMELYKKFDFEAVRQLHSD